MSFTCINDSKIAWAIAALITNVGARYAITPLSEMNQHILSTGLAQYIIIACIAFMSTRDILVSIILSAIVGTISQFAKNIGNPSTYYSRFLDIDELIDFID